MKVNKPPELQRVPDDKRLEVFITGSASDPGKIHMTLWVPETDEAICTCEGFRYNGKCRHVNSLPEPPPGLGRG